MERRRTLHATRETRRRGAARNDDPLRHRSVANPTREVRLNMLKKKEIVCALLATMVAMLVLMVSRANMNVVTAQSGAGPATPGDGVGSYMPPATQVIASQLPIASGATMGPVRVHPEHNIIPAAEMAAAKAAAAAGGGNLLPTTLQLGPQRPGGGAATPLAFLSFDGDTERETACGGW